MHLYFDESGDFAFPTEDYAVYVQAGLICPDSIVDEVEHYVHNKKAELGVDQLHASELPEDELVEICRWLDAGPLSLVGQATDTEVMTDAQITQHREEQAATLNDNFDAYQQAGGGWDGAEAKRAELASRVNNSEYIQASMLVGLIHAALFKSMRDSNVIRLRPSPAVELLASPGGARRPR